MYLPKSVTVKLYYIKGVHLHFINYSQHLTVAVSSVGVEVKWRQAPG